MKGAGLELWVHDFRLAARSLRRNLGFSSIVVLTLALGIGATTAIFSVVNGVLLKPLPFEDIDRVAVIWENDRDTGTLREPGSWPDFLDIQAGTRTFDDVATFSSRSANLIREGADPARVQITAATHNLSSVLGISPVLGRGIQAREARPGGELVAVLSDGFWARGFGRSPDALGRTLVIDDASYTVVGVFGPGLVYPDRQTDLWVPLQTDAEQTPRYTHPFTMVGRLASGVSVEAAQVEAAQIMTDLEAAYPENEARGAFVEPLTQVLRGNVSLPLMILFGAVFTVLLVACGNVANLFLARGHAARRNWRCRRQWGASAARVARKFLAESLLLTGAAVAAGVVLAFVGLRAIVAVAPAEVLALGEGESGPAGPGLHGRHGGIRRRPLRADPRAAGAELGSDRGAQGRPKSGGRHGKAPGSTRPGGEPDGAGHGPSGRFRALDT